MGQDAVFCRGEEVRAKVMYLWKIFPRSPEPDKNVLDDFLALVAVAAFCSGEAVELGGVPVVYGFERLFIVIHEE